MTDEEESRYPTDEELFGEGFDYSSSSGPPRGANEEWDVMAPQGDVMDEAKTTFYPEEGDGEWVKYNVLRDINDNKLYSSAQQRRTAKRRRDLLLFASTMDFPTTWTRRALDILDATDFSDTGNYRSETLILASLAYTAREAGCWIDATHDPKYDEMQHYHRDKFLDLCDNCKVGLVRVRDARGQLTIPE